VSSGEVADAVEHGWEISAGIETLLKSALQGDREIRFHPGDVDTNSRGLLALFFNRIREHVATAASAAGQAAELVFDTPTVSRPECPICRTETTGDDCRTCNVARNAMELGKRLEKTLFKKVKDLFFKVVLSRTPAEFSTEVEELIEGEEIRRLESGGWLLKGGIAILLRAAASGAKNFKFVGAMNMDSNSRGVLSYLFNTITDSLPGNAEAVAVGITVEKPYIAQEEPLELVTSRYPLREHTRRFLNARADVFRRVSAIIVSGGSDSEWVSFVLHFFV